MGLRAFRGSLSQRSCLSGWPSSELVMKRLRVKSVMRPGAVDCLCRAGAGYLESSQKLREGRAAKGSRGGDEPLQWGLSRGRLGMKF